VGSRRKRGNKIFQRKGARGPDAQSSPVRGGITDQPVDIVARLDAAEIKPPFSKPMGKNKNNR
jgi:hypothetical protein